MSVSFSIEVGEYKDAEFDFINVDRDGEAFVDFDLMTESVSMTLCITAEGEYDDTYELRLRSEMITGPGAALIDNVINFGVSLSGDAVESTELPQQFDITSSQVSVVSAVSDTPDSASGYGCTITFSNRGVTCALCGYNLSGPDATWLTLLDNGC
jgi:hypothetical protein